MRARLLTLKKLYTHLPWRVCSMNKQLLILFMITTCLGAEFAYAKKEAVLPTPPSDVELMKRAYESQNELVFKKYISKLLMKNPNHFEALKYLADYHLKNDRLGLAQIIFNKALKKFPKSPEIHNNLGIIALKRNMKEEAVFLFWKTLKYDRSHLEAMLNLSSIYLESYNFERALSLLKRAYPLLEKNMQNKELRSQYTKVMNNFAVALSWSRKSKEAQKIYNSILENADISVNILLNYATLLVDVLDNRRKASRILEKADFLDHSDNYNLQIKRIRNRITNKR